MSLYNYALNKYRKKKKYIIFQLRYFWQKNKFLLHLYLCTKILKQNTINYFSIPNLKL